MNVPSPGYTAAAGHAELGFEELTGELRIDRQGLLFEHASGALGFPFSRLRIDRTTDGRIQFSDPEQAGWTVYTYAEEILRLQPFQQRNELRAQVRDLKRREEGRRRVRLTVRFLAVFAAIVLGVMLTGPLVITFLMARVPPSAEVRLGELALEELGERLQFAGEPGLDRYVERLGAAVERGLPPHPYRFTFRVVESPWPNAFALPGGTVLVTSGLIQTVESSEEIAGVLAHEMAHVLHRHGLRTLITSVGPLYVLQVFVSDRQGFLATVTQGSQLILSQSFSRDYEREADASGFQYLVQAGIDPRGLGRFLERISRDQGSIRSFASTPEILRSHPPDEERLRHLEQLWSRSRVRDGFVQLDARYPEAPEAVSRR